MLDINNLVCKVLDVFIKDNMVFTAYDVTREARTKTRENVRHQEVRPIVHSLMQNYIAGGAYLSDLKDFGGPAGPAIVYYPNAINPVTDCYYTPNDYVPRKPKVAPVAPVAAPVHSVSISSQPGTQGVSSVPVAPIVVPPPAAPPLSVPVSSTLAKPDGRGRVCIPANVVRAAGMAHGDTAYIVTNPGLISVSKAPPLAYQFAYQVDNWNNIRLSGHVLDQAKMNGKPNYQIVVGSTNTIEVWE